MEYLANDCIGGYSERYQVSFQLLTVMVSLQSGFNDRNWWLCGLDQVILLIIIIIKIIIIKEICAASIYHIEWKKEKSGREVL